MRPLAIIPMVCCIAAVALAFMCLFAGHKKSFMEEYHIITLNTSRIGYNLLNTTSEESANPLEDLLKDIKDKFKDEINQFAGDMAERLGIEDFYSLHLLTFCSGDYVPGPMANETVKQDDITKDVTDCSKAKAMFTWNPTETLERRLNETGLGVTLEDLGWPDEIQDGINTLQTVQKAAFILYCLSIAFIFITLIAAFPGFYASGRLLPALNILLSTLSFITIGLSSALMTALIVKGSEVINKNGKDIGVEAHLGGKFMTITWASTAAMFIATFVWCVEICFGERVHRRQSYVTKEG
ncbi:integral membrane protein-like protein [Aaosphaeria arxii CBS 175.79]|uniref:Integral membrane protein-like protein n=1 Tax=Aaosphaeria arxii CBS 175.79 TaxID=1450172 RepID=A0A6A5XLH1_9PLEO|nr:integral membrane protein-like protein [Aaosphaeria arxii CBS 175.79]KAF2013144.1 integral membrane protein-like protein [Aaosphaeria arxii CBS 175.79]